MGLLTGVWSNVHAGGGGGGGPQTLRSLLRRSCLLPGSHTRTCGPGGVLLRRPCMLSKSHTHTCGRGEFLSEEGPSGGRPLWCLSERASGGGGWEGRAWAWGSGDS